MDKFVKKWQLASKRRWPRIVEHLVGYGHMGIMLAAESFEHMQRRHPTFACH